MQQQVFYPNDKVYYKRDQILGPGGQVYKGPAVVLGKRGQVYWIVHQNKVLRCTVSRMISVEDAEGISIERDDDIESVQSKTVFKDSLPPTSQSDW